MGITTRIKFSFTLQIAFALFLGLATGLFYGPLTAPLGEVSQLIISLIKMTAAPLLFFSIVSAIIKTHVHMRDGLKMIIIACVNATLAVILGLILSHFFDVGLVLKQLAITIDASKSTFQSSGEIHFLQTFISYFPKSFIGPFVDNSIIPIIFTAILIGSGLRSLSNRQPQQSLALEPIITEFLNLFERLISWLVKLTPIAVFAAVAKSVGEYGLAPLQSLIYFVGVVLLGFFIHVMVVYQSWIYFVGMSLRKFWLEAKVPAINSIGTNSSLATLPLTLQALDRLKVSKSASALGACVGTNLNNDGIILYEAMAVIFISQAMGMELSISQQLLTVLSCMVAAMGVAGVPEAGFISLSLVLATVGLPMELLPLLLTVDWILARARSVVNVLSDMTISIVINRFETRHTKN